MVAWSERVEIKHQWTNEFCVELRIKYENESTDTWVMFVYRSTYVKERHQQWEFLKNRKYIWGSNWVIGGDFNDIKSRDRKKRER